MASARTGVVIPAGGRGMRMGGGIPKQFIPLGGKPILVHTLERFERCAAVDMVVLAAPGRMLDQTADLVRNAGMKKVTGIVEGGRERQDSVAAGLASLPGDLDVILVHDAVRPFVTDEQIKAVIRAALRDGAALLAVPEKVTVKEAAGRYVSSTPDRSRLWQAQTPQGFRADLFRQAVRKAMDERFFATDDAALVERMGCRVKIVEGDERNIKITSPADLAVAEWILKEAGA
ncbi:2-C-methyl-D-erythritol 4-phosphate cytidylyltransferase [bacterium]|nr:2-C-methyl-D-erythritol 4-phosphate cytidylyltransferase [bacterium]